MNLGQIQDIIRLCLEAGEWLRDALLAVMSSCSKHVNLNDPIQLDMFVRTEREWLGPALRAS